MTLHRGPLEVGQRHRASAARDSQDECVGEVRVVRQFCFPDRMFEEVAVDGDVARPGVGRAALKPVRVVAEVADVRCAVHLSRPNGLAAQLVTGRHNTRLIAQMRSSPA